MIGIIMSLADQDEQGFSNHRTRILSKTGQEVPGFRYCSKISVRILHSMYRSDASRKEFQRDYVRFGFLSEYGARLRQFGESGQEWIVV